MPTDTVVGPVGNFVRLTVRPPKRVQLTVNATGTYSIETVAEDGVDPVLYLYQQGNNSTSVDLITMNDDFGDDDLNSRLEATLQGNTDYFVEIREVYGDPREIELHIQRIGDTTPAGQEAAIRTVSEELLRWLVVDDDYDLVPEFGQWGVLIGWFSQDERKETTFRVQAGEHYRIAGAGDGTVTDLDICVYDEDGREVQCDEAIDNIPLIMFTAASSGAYRAVLRAYELDAFTAYAGMTLLRRRGR